VPSENSVITTDPKFSTMSLVQVYQPLSQLYSVHLNVELLKVGKQLSQEQLRQQRQEISNSIKEAYYGLLQTQSALEAADENLRALREVDRTTEEYVKEKATLPYQGAAVKVQLAQAELQLVTLQDTFATQKENLNDLMGQDIRLDFSLGGVPDVLPEEQNIEMARETALAKRTEIRQAKFKIDQAVYSKRLQKAQYIPEVGIQYLLFVPFSIEGLPTSVNSLGITMKWDLYDWGYKRHLSDEKQRGIEQSQLNLAETRSQVAIDLDNRFRKLREARDGVTNLRRGDQQIPVVSRLRMEERATLSDIQNLYVYSSSSNNKVPLIEVSKIENTLQTLRIRHLEHFRTISVQSFTAPGVLPSEVFSPAASRLADLQKTLPPGYNISTSGEQAKQVQGFKNLSVIMGISIALIFLALAFQFKHSIKPILVLAAAPYGVAGALIALYLMGSAFGFMAFLGIASLIGVIVSHVIVLFDFIEEMHEKGEPLEQALLDAGIVRLRPVLITVGATILALFPLAIHGGPLWQPLCYAQIGGLGVATFITLLLVRVLYSIFVLDLKIVAWGSGVEQQPVDLTAHPKGEIS
jgi:preprotein translocase subunit SecF